MKLHSALCDPTGAWHVFYPGQAECLCKQARHTPQDYGNSEGPTKEIIDAIIKS